MNKNRLLIAVVVLAILAGALISNMRAREAASGLEKPSVTLPKLKSEEITKLELDNPEKKLKVTLIKDAKKEGDKEDSWSLTEPLAAKADKSAVDGMVENLAALEVASIAATRKENHARLGVDEAKGIHVKAYGGDELLFDAYIGESKSGGNMLRKQGDEVVVATRSSVRFSFDKELRYLRDRTISDVDNTTIKALALTSPKGRFKFEKPEGGKWQQAKGEKPIKDYADGKVESLVSSFARLRAADFAESTATPADTGLDAPAATLVLTPKEGSELTFQLGKLDSATSQYFLRASTSPVVFKISRYTGDSLVGEPSATFGEAPKKPGEEDKGMPVAGGGDLPPEILKQLQQQAQGMMGGVHPH